MTDKTEPVSEPYKLPIADGKSEERRVFAIENDGGVLWRLGFDRENAENFAASLGQRCVEFVERREPTACERTEMVNAAWSALKSRGVTNLSAADVEAAIESALRKCGAE